MKNNLIQSLRQLIKEELAFSEASSQGRLPKGLTVDSEKASKIKQLYPKEYIVYKIVDAIENPGDKVVTRAGYKDPSTGEFVDGLMQMFGFKTQQALNVYMSELTKNGIVLDKETAVPKKEKPEATGQRGRKSSDKSRAGVIRTLFQNWKDNPDYTPSEEDITYDIPKGLGTEKLSDTDVSKIKNSALGLVKRGRPKMQKESLYEIYKRLQNLK